MLLKLLGNIVIR